MKIEIIALHKKNTILEHANKVLKPQNNKNNGKEMVAIIRYS